MIYSSGSGVSNSALLRQIRNHRQIYQREVVYRVIQPTSGTAVRPDNIIPDLFTRKHAEIYYELPKKTVSIYRTAVDLELIC
jgi:hypothetical protein